MVEISSHSTSLAFLFPFYPFLRFLGAIWCLWGVRNKKPKAAGPEHGCPSTDHPFKTINLQPVVYLQDAASVPPSSLIPDRHTVDVAASSLHHPLGPHWRNSWSICSLSRKQQEAGQQGLPTQSPGCNDCLSRLALIWKRACFPKAAKASNSHHNYLNFLMIWITLSRPRLVLGWSCTNSIYIKLQSFPQRDYCS